MKRLSIIILAVLLIGTAGCSGKTSSESSKTQPQSQISDKKESMSESSKPLTDESSENSKPLTDESSENSKPHEEETDTENIITEVVDKNSRHIGEIRKSGSVTLTDYGIFYTTVKTLSVQDAPITTGTADNVTTTTYHLYDPVKNEHYDFGSVSGQDYEAGYVRTEIDGRLYTLITTGNALDNIPDDLLLVEFDLVKHSIQQYKLSDNGFPYTAMTEINGNLLILNHDQQEKLCDKLLLFNTKTKDCQQVLEFELNNNQGDTIRGIYSDGEQIYLLRLHFEDENNIRMFLDSYDIQFQKLSEKDISPMIQKSVEKSLTPADIPNEMKQMLSRFMVLNRQYVYYENFSATCFLGNTETGELFKEFDGMGGLFLAASGSGKPFFYYIFGGGDNVKENAVFEWKDGTLEKSVFAADDERYYIVSATVSPNGKKLIQTEYVNPNDRNDSLPARLYYF